nr:MAG TPA: hypothetical protein [Caudoviricetes sp.]
MKLKIDFHFSSFDCILGRCYSINCKTQVGH